MLARVAAALGDICRCEIEKTDPHVINIRYPGAFPDRYLRPEVRLEIGPLASWLPHEERLISCYAAEAFPQVFARRECPVRVIRAERTFWEKATILHHEAHRPEGSPQPPRYSRHYYDLAKMAESPVKATALADTTLLADVVLFKQRFYPRGWARYDQAQPGTFRLVPTGTVLAAVEADYRAMGNMIFGEVPALDRIMTLYIRRTNADPSKVRSKFPPAQVFPNAPTATRLDRNFARHADCRYIVTPKNKKATTMGDLSA